MTVILETERLLLRTWSPADRDDGFKIWSDPEVMRYIGTGRPNESPDETSAWLARMIAHQERHGFCYWAIVEKESGQLIGSCGMVYQLDGSLPIDFGYTLARSRWGRGLTTEAARAALHYAFERLRLPRMVASVDSRNVASRRVLEKIGFVFERSEEFPDGVDLWYEATSNQD